MKFARFLLNQSCFIIITLLSIVTTSCTQRSADSQPISLTPGISILQPGAAYLTPAGDYQLNTMRSLNGQNIFCSQPSPNWATAVGSAQALAASGGVSGKASASFTGSASTTEAITAMLGRTAGVVALRGGLYNACQAYANQIIGKDAYSLILSQYGNLLVALAGVGAATSSGAASSPSSAPLPGIAVAVSTGTGPGSTKPASSDNGSAIAGNQLVSQMQQAALQALLVSCINENDPSAHPDASKQNVLLDPAFCGQLLDAVVKQVPNLLASQTISKK